MKWILKNIPQFGMDLMINFMMLLPESIGVRIFSFLVPSLCSMNDDELDFVIHKMTASVFKFKSNANSYKFARVRLATLMLMSEKDAVRLVKYMSKACKEGTLGQYSRDQGMMQKAILNAPHDLQKEAIHILTQAGATGALPIETGEELQNVQKVPNVKKISLSELKKWIKENKKFVLVEVLQEENYDHGHIPKAINISADQFEEVALKVLKKDDCIVTYCRDISCSLSSRCSEYLSDHGYINVFHFPGGKAEWLQKGELFEKEEGIHCTGQGCNVCHMNKSIKY